MKKDLNKILIVNLGGIGDILISTPALRALAGRFPDSEMYLLTIPRAYEFVKGLPYLKKIFILRMGAAPANIFENIKTILSLRKMRIDAAINMRTLVSSQGAFKIRCLLNIINPKVKAGRDTEGRGSFFDIKIQEPAIGTRYEMEYDIELVKLLGAEVIDRSIDFKLDDAGIKKIDEALWPAGVAKDDILVGIHPGGTPSHRWPVNNFLKTAEEIGKRTRCKFVITGMADERKLAQKFKNIKTAEIINFAGIFSLMELGALIKRCDLYITNDTAPMHIAAILDTPLIAIFSPRYLYRFDPKNISDKAIVLCKEAGLGAITPEEVTEAALKLLPLRGTKDR